MHCASSDGCLYSSDLQNGFLATPNFTRKKVSKASADCVVAHPKIPQKLGIVINTFKSFVLNRSFQIVISKIDGIFEEIW